MVSFEFYHPDRGRWWREGRLDPEAKAILLPGDGPLPVVAVSPHEIQVAGRPCRRILDDGSIVDYPRTVDARFVRHATRLRLHRDGTLLFSHGDGDGGLAERGRYDLYRGYAHLPAWGGARTIELLDDGDLRVGEARFVRDAGA